MRRRRRGGEHVPWRRGPWQGLATPVGTAALGTLLAAAAAQGGRSSRHARTFPLIHGDQRLWVKVYDRSGARFAWRAFAMCEALRAAAIPAPAVVLVGRHQDGRGLLVTADVGGRALLDAVTTRAVGEKRRLLRRLGSSVARLHALGFVAGDLVPSNVMVRDGHIVFLDHDRTRRSRVLVWWQGRRNLVQLGRFVVPGLTLADRARVLRAYAEGRGWGGRRRRRLARWLVAKITARRERIDGMAEGTASVVGFRELMRSGGPHDPARREEAP